MICPSMTGLDSAVMVAAAAPAAFAQTAPPPEARVEQPQWIARPLFGETEVYVLPKGLAAFVFTLRPTTGDDGSTVVENAYRAEFGLPGRFQLGLHATGRAADRHRARSRHAIAIYRRDRP